MKEQRSLIAKERAVLKELEKKNKLNLSQLKEQNNKEINETESQKTIEIIHETKSWFFEKSNKIDKPLAKLTKKQKKLRDDSNYKYP